jgi:hypothetical protein
MHNTLQGLVCVNDTTIVDSLLLNERRENNPNAHSEPLLAKGHDLIFQRSVFHGWAPSGMSAALAIYNDTLPTYNVTVDDCLIRSDKDGVAYAGYSAYFGSSHMSNPPAHTVKVRRNHIGRGRAGWYTAFNASQPGSEFTGNVLL